MKDLLDRREVRIRRMFDGIAPKYDLLNHLLSLNIDKAWRRRVVKTLPATTGPILDMCTGTGDLALEYHRATGGKVSIVGADFSGRMLELAVKKTAKNKPPTSWPPPKAWAVAFRSVPASPPRRPRAAW